MQASRLVPNLLLSIIFTYLITLLLHGFVHQLAAYSFDLSATPWYDFWNHDFWIPNVRENRAFASFDQQGDFFKIGLAGFSGYIVHWAVLLLALAKLPKVSDKAAIFVYWLLFWNLVAVFSYIPHQVFNTININHVFNTIGVSVWMVYVLGGMSTLVVMYILFYYELPQMLDRLHILSMPLRRLYFSVSILTLLFYSSLHYLCVESTGSFSEHMIVVTTNFIFWFKLVLLIIISFNINLKSRNNHH